MFGEKQWTGEDQRYRMKKISKKRAESVFGEKQWTGEDHRYRMKKISKKRAESVFGNERIDWRGP